MYQAVDDAHRHNFQVGVHANGDVTIDMVLKAYERVLQRKYNLENLELHQLPIERVHEIGRSFDLVVCTGVLHHLPDPDCGLRALRDVLRPSGAMRLMVYARYGRTGISVI